MISFDMLMLWIVLTS